jgi:polar amino acid transport system substrate-binding protein
MRLTHGLLLAAAGLCVAAGTACAEVKLLTGSNYAPFTDQNWPQNGMVTEIVEAGLSQSPSTEAHSLLWEDDWAIHFDALADREADMGFPWFRPDCDDSQRNDHRCLQFHFSDPLLELVILLFTRTDNEFIFEDDADIEGRSLCRPQGYFTHDLDRPGRNWLSEEKVTLVQPATPAECFDLLVAGAVDAVAVNEFLGVKQLFAQGLTETVVPLPRALSTESLHLLVPKTHWRATALLYRFNAGLARLRQSGAYSQIVERHLKFFWTNL